MKMRTEKELLVRIKGQEGRLERRLRTASIFKVVGKSPSQQVTKDISDINKELTELYMELGKYLK